MVQLCHRLQNKPGTQPLLRVSPILTQNVLVSQRAALEKTLVLSEGLLCFHYLSKSLSCGREQELAEPVNSLAEEPEPLTEKEMCFTPCTDSVLG